MAPFPSTLFVMYFSSLHMFHCRSKSASMIGLGVIMFKFPSFTEAPCLLFSLSSCTIANSHKKKKILRVCKVCSWPWCQSKQPDLIFIICSQHSPWALVSLWNKRTCSEIYSKTHNLMSHFPQLYLLGASNHTKVLLKRSI